MCQLKTRAGRAIAEQATLTARGQVADSQSGTGLYRESGPCGPEANFVDQPGTADPYVVLILQRRQIYATDGRVETEAVIGIRTGRLHHNGSASR